MNIIKQVDFYYLAHSFRKSRKVVHREKYLGKQVPPDIEAIKRRFSENAFKKGP